MGMLPHRCSLIAAAFQCSRSRSACNQTLTESRPLLAMLQALGRQGLLVLHRWEHDSQMGHS